MTRLIAAISISAAFFASVNACYEQCGGIGWTGSTTCVDTCVCTYSNPYYSQCIPPTTTGKTTSASSTTSKATTTTSSTSTVKTTTSTSTVTTTSKTTTSTTSSSTAEPSGSGPNKTIAKVPVLGWNSWNAYGGNINEAVILATANSMVSLGLKAAGYQFVDIDDTWSNITGRDPTTQRILPDSNKFPNGIEYLATEIHNLGLKFGIYGDAGLTTCSGFPGSLYYEDIDAQTFSDWGVDLIKYDNCAVPANCMSRTNIPPTRRFATYEWGKTLLTVSSKRMMKLTRKVTGTLSTRYHARLSSVFVNGGRTRYGLGGHQWRLTGDSSSSWSFVTSAITTAASVATYTNFYGHGDMDMMEIGNGGLSSSEERTHFAAWSFLKSPIILGTNLTNLSPAQISVITNSELLAFSQDTTYGAPALQYDTTNPPTYFSGSSSAGQHAFGVNYVNSTASLTFTFSAIPQLANKTSWLVHDMWAKKDIGTFSGSYTASVAGHDTAALRFT
ncbi:hypothetical protein FRB98_002428 [Tulasnella sp. 332]|nr:hypothetical protein FRB98_002428 [Tulasnella sp. 332]